MKKLALALSLSLAIVAAATAAFAQTAAAAAPATSATAATAAPAFIAVTAAESAKIAADLAAYKAAQAAEQAPLKALLSGQALNVPAGSQTALHAATVSALDAVKADLFNSAAAHAVDPSQLSYSPTQSAWVKSQHGGGGQSGMPLTQ